MNNSINIFEYRSLASVHRQRCGCELCMPAGKDENGYPVLRAVTVTESDDPPISKLFCTYCRSWHRHGEGDGYRCAHCWLKSSPYKESDYSLLIVENLSTETFKHKEWTRQHIDALNNLPSEVVANLLDPSGPHLNEVLEGYSIWTGCEDQLITSSWPVPPKRSANGTSRLFKWIAAQVERDDPVGDVARDAVADDRFPRMASKLDTVTKFLAEVGAGDLVIEVWQRAYAEYSRRQETAS